MFLIQGVTNHRHQVPTNQGRLGLRVGLEGRGDLGLEDLGLGDLDSENQGNPAQVLSSNRATKSVTRVVTRKWTMEPTRGPLEATVQLFLAGLVSDPHLFLQSRQLVLHSCH